MRTISIHATDTLFFRDGRPFSMSEDSIAQGIFPPPPSVLYGALRASFISLGLENEKEFSDLATMSEQLRIRFMAFQAGVSQYFPLPADLVVPKYQKQTEAQALQLEDAPAFSNKLTQKVLRSTVNGKMTDEPHLIQLLTLEGYLNGQSEKIPVRKLFDFLTPESKIGIGRDPDTNIADGGKLYRIQANRLAKDYGKHIQKLAFLLGIEGLEIAAQGWLTLGGERKVAFFQNADSCVVTCPQIKKEQFKIYLATPAVFRSGWYPEKLLEKHDLTLLTAAIGKPLQIGGWDIEQGRPKPMLQFVPAGSVYYVEAKSTQAAIEAAKAIREEGISDIINETNFNNMGFGIAYTGNIGASK